MTKSTITREQQRQILIDTAQHIISRDNTSPYSENLREIARIALAAIDSEPVAWTWQHREQWHVTNDEERARDLAWDGTKVIPLYRHAQPAPVVMDDIKLRELFDSWFASDCSFDRSPEASEEDNIAWRESYWYVWQRCRAAMLQAGNSPVIPGAEQRIADAVELLQKAAPAMLADNGGPDGPLAGRMKSPVIPEGWQVEAEKLAEIYGMSFVLFRHGEAPQCADPTKVVISFTDKGLGHDTLPSGPKEVK
ncbi:DUF551 domain-containing protein [Klebsiella michiganensis]|uniref:hypothetical protein n=1 Tax=Klebsiella michiganensis TaxID=1134687 RepID=UPI003B237530